MNKGYFADYYFSGGISPRDRLLQEQRKIHKEKYPHYDALVGKPIKQAEKNKRKCD